MKKIDCNSKNMKDAELWGSFLRGGKESFSDIYEYFFPLLSDYGARLYKDDELVKDCIHDLFIKLWVNRENLSQTTCIKPYLFVALRSIILNKVIKIRRMSLRADQAMAINSMDIYNDTVEDFIITADEEMIKKKRIRDAMNSLTNRQKKTIFLRFYLGLEYPEIASVMQVSLKASYKIVGRAILSMRKYFKDESLNSF